MERGKRQMGIVATILFAAALVSVGSRCWREQRPVENPQHPIRSAFCDFQDVVYFPTQAALGGVNPYDPRPADEGGQYFARFPAGNSFPLYSPLIFVASLPFAILDLTTAELVYWIVNVGLLVGYGYLLLRVSKQRVTATGLMGLATLLLLSRPGYSNLYFGNVTLPMVLATIGSWWLAERRPWLSGLLLALACIKPTFGGPLFVLLLLRGNYRAALSGLAIAAIANLAVLAALLPQLLNLSHVSELLTINQAATESNAAVDPLVSPSRVDLLIVVERLIGRHFPDLLRYVLTFLVLIVTGVAIRRGVRVMRPDQQRAELNALAFVCLTISLCIYHNIYDALLIAPAAIVAFQELTQSRPQERRGTQWLLFALLILPAVNYFTSTKFIAIVGETLPSLASIVQHPAVWTLLCVLNGVALTIAWAIFLGRSFRTDRASEPQASK